MSLFQPHLFCATHFRSGALVAQNKCATTSKRPIGKMGGANATPLPRASGAVVAQAHFTHQVRLTRLAQAKATQNRLDRLTNIH